MCAAHTLALHGTRHSAGSSVLRGRCTCCASRLTLTRLLSRLLAAHSLHTHLHTHLPCHPLFVCRPFLGSFWLLPAHSLPRPLA